MEGDHVVISGDSKGTWLAVKQASLRIPNSHLTRSTRLVLTFLTHTGNGGRASAEVVKSQLFLVRLRL